MTLPAGLMPHDLNIEIFADPDHFGKCLFVQHGRVQPFHELPIEVIPALYEECFMDKKAVKAMRMMGIKSEAMVEQYNYCNRGALDGIPDVSTSGKLTREFFDCGRRGKCPREGLVCKMTFGQIKITPRELQCLRLNSKGKSYAEIRCEMGFNSQNSVNSLMSRLRDKMGVGSKSALIAISNQLGIF